SARRLLEKLGFPVAEAPNGRDALGWLEANQPPAAVLLDLVMPQMDGFEFLDRFRGRAEWREIPVIVLTAKQLSAAERERLDGRTRQVVAKSDATADLATVIDQAVRRRSAGVLAAES